MIFSELLVFGLLMTIMLLCAGSIVYSTIKVGIPPMPSSRKAYLAMVSLINETGSGNIVDFGSGWGNLVIRMAIKYPQRKVIGYELSLLPWLISSLIKRALQLNNLTLHRQDFLKADLTDISVIVCYLFPGGMKKVSNKLQMADNGICYIVSNNFSLPQLKPTKTIKINDFYKSNIYLYKLNDKAPS